MALTEKTMEIDPMVVVEEGDRSRVKTLYPQELPPNRGEETDQRTKETLLTGFELIEHGYRHLVNERGECAALVKI